MKQNTLAIARRSEQIARLAIIVAAVCGLVASVMLTSSFTGLDNYTRDFGGLVKDAGAMKRFGGSMVLWDFHSRKRKKVWKRNMTSTSSARLKTAGRQSK